MPNPNFSIENLIFHAPKTDNDPRSPEHVTKKLYCKFCPGTTFHNADEFCLHLRTTHCSKEGGSYVCRYIFVIFINCLILCIFLLIEYFSPIINEVYEFLLV